MYNESFFITKRQKAVGFKIGANKEVLTEHRLHIEEGTIFSKLNPKLVRCELFLSLGNISQIRWETLCFIKSGAMKGVNAGTVTVACLEQIESAEALIAFTIGKDAGVLEPGHYSKEILEKICFFMGYI